MLSLGIWYFRVCIKFHHLSVLLNLNSKRFYRPYFTMIANCPAWYVVCDTILPNASALVFVPNSLVVMVVSQSSSNCVPTISFNFSKERLTYSLRLFISIHSPVSYLSITVLALTFISEAPKTFLAKVILHRRCDEWETQHYLRMEVIFWSNLRMLKLPIG